jgi:hypothetical protein
VPSARTLLPTNCLRLATRADSASPAQLHVRRPGIVHARWRVYSLAIGLSVGLLGGCVELPGIYYNVLIDERPSESDCANLTQALTAKLNLQLQPSPYQCSVTLESDGTDPARNVVINTYFRQRRIVVEINEFRFGNSTVPSPSTQQFAQQVMQIVHEQFPTAELMRFRAKRGPFGP